MVDRVVRQFELCEILGGVSDTTLWRIRQQEDFPKPFHLGGSSINVWMLTDIDKYIQLQKSKISEGEDHEK